VKRQLNRTSESLINGTHNSPITKVGRGQVAWRNHGWTTHRAFDQGPNAISRRSARPGSCPIHGISRPRLDTPLCLSLQKQGPLAAESCSTIGAAGSCPGTPWKIRADVIERDKVVKYDEDLTRLFPIPNAKANAQKCRIIDCGCRYHRVRKDLRKNTHLMTRK
jgi:hypothetical protein